ncbi:uncharacterized protein EDB91DRAFT_77863 [Suillus paluster]|uniref:uncharacterized protein n=1 Tax=Suillus paluster TaxID=48578 RepID=UPI001B879480|nr:uncharacterized protein EDB91DRAFT_77863 [Suillus paluster]KAG1725996.1 hypothetical protein EDB91DRAFT_77863 [Suillus paluster]
MNVAGPSRPRPVPNSRKRDNYEEDLVRMMTQLDLSDVERFQTLHDNKARRGERLSDREVAFALLMQNARELAEFDVDLALAQRLAVEEGGEPDPAPRPATLVQRAVTSQPAVRNTASQKQTWATIASQNSNAWVSAALQNQNTWTTIATKAPPRRATGHDCVICQDPIFGAEVRAPCGHFYDIDCITELFQSATRDESLYPPRCCRQNIPLPRVRPHLTQAVLSEFELKAQEFGTLKRVYCVAPTCSRFLGPLHEGYFSKVLTCPSPTCTTTTCGKCRGRYEGFTHLCTPDADSEQVLTLSDASGWSRCPGCAQMIELDTGCFHMTCRCRTEFCYLCRALWKNCTCPQWDEARLLAAAERRLDAQFPPVRRAQPANPPQQAPAVRRPAPAAGTIRIQPVNPPRLAPAAGAGVVRIQPVNLPAPTRAPIPAPAPPPAPRLSWAAIARSQVALFDAEVPAPAPAPPAPAPPRSWGAFINAEVPAPAPPAPPRSLAAFIDAEVLTPAPPPAPSSRSRTRRAKTNALWFTGMPVPQPASTAATAGDRNTVRERMIMEIMELLRVDHDCQHRSWEYHSGGGNCESCYMYLPLYLFRCGGCQFLACNRCRRNRL